MRVDVGPDGRLHDQVRRRAARFGWLVAVTAAFAGLWFLRHQLDSKVLYGENDELDLDRAGIWALGCFVPFALVIPWGFGGLAFEWGKSYFYRDMTGDSNRSHAPL